MFKFLKKTKKEYNLINVNDSVLVPTSPGVFREAVVINTQNQNDKYVLHIKFPTGQVHYITASLCYKIIKGIAVPLEKPKHKKQKIVLWFLRKFGLAEV